MKNRKQFLSVNEYKMSPEDKFNMKLCAQNEWIFAGGRVIKAAVAVISE